MARSFLAPEVLQISSMDCGVAALCCTLAGHGIPVSYEKLRENCQTSVDGTNIDSLEQVANALGLDVMQHLVPPDLLWDVAANRLPAIAVAQLQDARNLHFVALWRCLGSRVQVMDPAGGRRWPGRSSLESELYVHELVFDDDVWRQWFGTSTFRDAMEARAARHLSARTIADIVTPALHELDAVRVGILDAALRLVARTLETSGARPVAWRDELFARAWNSGLRGHLPPPLHFMSATEGRVATRGVLLLAPVEEGSGERDSAHIASRSAEMGLANDQARPIVREVLDLLGSDGRTLSVAVSLGVVAMAVTTALELLLYRAAIDAPRLFSTARLRMGASATAGILMLSLLALEALVTLGGNRLSRRLELAARMRTLFLLPRVPDAFVRSRPTSDLAYRAHAISEAGSSVASVIGALRAAGELAITLLAISLLDPRYAAGAACGAILFVVAWRIWRPRLQELDTRLQVHASRLQNVLLDALRGTRPVRLHGFQHALRNEQFVELHRWKHSSEGQFEAVATLQAAYSSIDTLLVAGLFGIYLLTSGDPRTFVLLALWSMRLPANILQLVQFAQSFPQQRNALVRTLEITRHTPLADASPEPVTPPTTGMGLSFRNVDVEAGGQVVLENLTLDIPAGQHVAVVGPSGSGKSTLVGLLLGHQQVARGEIRVDGTRLDDGLVRAIRPSIAWIDPAVQLWNTTVTKNFEYAAVGRPQRSAVSVLDGSDLMGVLGGLEHGLDTNVGADGAFLSGGEGQRLRLGRALLPSGTRLAILDEAFRGLERSVRERLADQVRATLRKATMIFISHDVKQAISFERVLVVEGGRIVEDGVPAQLANQDTRFAAMLRAERELVERCFGLGQWRSIRVENGAIQESNDVA